MKKINSVFEIKKKYSEPWVKLENGNDLKDWNRQDEIKYNQINRQIYKYEFYRKIFDFLVDNRIFGDYYEFGCHRCRTFRMCLTEARKHNLKNMSFYAFDSFEGLPEHNSNTSVEIWKKGVLTTSENDFLKMTNSHNIYKNNIYTIKGYYENTLTKKLQKKYLDNGNKASLINIDCDLYESAVPIFNFIEPLLQEGTCIYLDDLFAGYKGSPNKGVFKAFNEYIKKSRWKFVKHLDIGWWGQSYITYL